MTICVKCRFYKDTAGPVARIFAGANHVCLAPGAQRSMLTNCITGEVSYHCFREERQVTVDSPHPPCNIINKDGNCPHYQPIEEPEV